MAQTIFPTPGVVAFLQVSTCVLRNKKRWRKQNHRIRKYLK